MLERSNRIDEALKMIDAAIALSPEMPEVHYDAALPISSMAGWTKPAQRSNMRCRCALISPWDTRHWPRFAQAEGKIDESVEIARKGLSVSGDMPPLYYTLARRGNGERDDPDFANLVALAENAESKGTQYCISLYFALSKAHERYR